MRWYTRSCQHSVFCSSCNVRSANIHFLLISFPLWIWINSIPFEKPQSPLFGIRWAGQGVALWDFPSWTWFIFRPIPVSVTFWSNPIPWCCGCVVVVVVDKLVFYFHFRFWFVYKIHQVYFFCKDLVTEPEFRGISRSSYNITLLYSETFPEHILFQFVPSAGPMFPLLELPLLFSARLTSDKW